MTLFMYVFLCTCS